MNRILVMLLLTALSAYARPFYFGVKGGVPLANSLKVADKATYFSGKSPAVFGPAIELRLPLGLGAEAGLFYRRLEYGTATSRTAGQVWEIPMLIKYSAPGVLVHPFIEAGLSARRLARFQQRTDGTSTSDPPELEGRGSAGPTVGGGVELRLPFAKLSAEIRYTRWGSSSFKSALGGLATQLNQADFLLGIMF